MSRTYEFYFNDRGHFTCTKTTSVNQANYYGEKAKVILRNKDRLRFNKAKVSEDKIVLSDNNTTIIIRDLEEFYDNDLCSCITHSLPKIKKAIIKYQKKKNYDKPIKHGNTKGLLTASILVVIMLATTAGLIKSNTEKFQITDEIENDYDELIELNSSVILETDDITASVDFESINKETNSLLDELERDNQLIADEPITSTYLRYDTEIDEVKAEHAYNNYYEIVENYATKWGISPNLAMSMLTQESGGYSVNLMQIQFDSWIDMPLTTYNFNDNRYDTIVLTDHPEDYKGKGYICITRTDLNNPKTNISVGCIILKKSCEYMNYHISAGIQCYNFGTGNMEKVLNATAKAEGLSRDELLADQTNLDFTNYTNIIDVGDPSYLQNVIRYIQNPENGFSIKYIDEFGEIQEESIAILPDKKTL